MDLKRLAIFIILAVFVLSATGCGETFSGIGTDVRRMGRGVKTIFVRDSVGE